MKNEFIYTLFYKNILYDNIEADKRLKIKNILRICRGSAGFSQKKDHTNFVIDSIQVHT